MSNLLLCVKDGREMKVVKNTVYAEQMVEGRPFRVYSSDKWGCPECGFEILLTAPIAIVENWNWEPGEHYLRIAPRVEVKFE